ncbi:MAG: hypothetical protein QM538_06590 [Methylacidiphilales bacterium]|nr:hypothetical protein [Candidatus Methylacidiphilales bacterium]
MNTEEHTKFINEIKRLVDLAIFLGAQTKKLKDRNLELHAENDILFRKLEKANDRIDHMISRYRELGQ